MSLRHTLLTATALAASCMLASQAVAGEVPDLRHAAVTPESGIAPKCLTGTAEAETPIAALEKSGISLNAGDLKAVKIFNFDNRGCDALALWNARDQRALSKMTDEERGDYFKVILKERAITEDVTSAVSGENGGMFRFVHRIKFPGSVYEVMHERAYTEADRVADLPDLIRYTAIFAEDTYMKNVLRTLNVLQDHGHEVYLIWNAWTDKAYPYNAINVMLRSHDGVRYELQFHTAQSAYISVHTHAMYEKRRVLPQDSPEYRQILRDQFEISDQTRVPAGVDELKTYIPTDKPIHG